MIQIDDAGSGSLLGGTIIGVNRVTPYEYSYELIPLDLYNGINFNKKIYLDHVVVIINRIFKKIGVTKNEKIQVCRGYMFDRLRKHLKDEHYNFESTIILDPLQSKIENSFEKYTMSLGLPAEFIKYTKYPFHFHSLLKWIYADYENRHQLCKTGWKSWKKYKELKTNITFDKIKKSNYVCLKCGTSITENSEVKKISYNSNRPTTIFLHNKC